MRSTDRLNLILTIISSNIGIHALFRWISLPITHRMRIGTFFSIHPIMSKCCGAISTIAFLIIQHYSVPIPMLPIFPPDQFPFFYWHPPTLHPSPHIPLSSPDNFPLRVTRKLHRVTRIFGTCSPWLIAGGNPETVEVTQKLRYHPDISNAL